MLDIDMGRYRKVSSKDGGEYAGPCYFTGDGEDRFRIFPYHPRFNDPVWFCRGGCAGCPGKRSKDGNYNYGFFNEDADISKVQALPKKTKRATAVPSLAEAKGYAKQLDSEALTYLEQRGISERVARRHLLGKRYGKTITIPNILTIKGKPVSYGIKWRWLPQYKPADTESYRMIAGSRAKSLYNFDILKKHHKVVVIVEAILDVLMLETLGIPAVAPFGGGGIWGAGWGIFFDCDTIINVADRDEPKPLADGSTWNPGEEYAERRALMLGVEDNQRYNRVITCLPPDMCDDLGTAYQSGVDVREFLEGITYQTCNTTSQSTSTRTESYRQSIVMEPQSIQSL